MAIYSPPVTFVSGTALTAAGLNSNLDALSASIAQRFTSSSDIEADAVTTSRILRPRIVQTFDATSVYLQTGSIHRLKYDALRYYTQVYNRVPFRNQTFITKFQNDGTLDRASYKPVPGTWLSYYLDEQAQGVSIQVQAEILIPFDETSPVETENVFHLKHDDTPLYETTCRVLEQTDAGYEWDRRLIQTCTLITLVDAGWHHVGLVGGILSNYAMVGGYHLTIEALY